MYLGDAYRYTIKEGFDTIPMFLRTKIMFIIKISKRIQRLVSFYAWSSENYGVFFPSLKPGMLHRGQTSEAFFVLFSGILFNVKWKHEQGCIKKLIHVTIFNFFSKYFFFVEN